MRFARLCARVVSALDLVIILTAPSWSVCLWRTTRTREQPPLPIVLPSCQWPMYCLRFLPDALVEVDEMAEFRLDSYSYSLAICETRLEPDVDAGSPLRTARVPLGSRDSLRARSEAGDEAISVLMNGECRWETGVFAWLRSSRRGCRWRLFAERLAL